MKIIILLTITSVLALSGYAQDIHANIFVRTPQVLNYRINNEVTYTPVISTGVGFAHKSKFIELATYIDQSDAYGFYTFFGATLISERVAQSLTLATNCFGEISYFPSQTAGKESFTYTSGICYFPNFNINHMNIGIPLCLGLAYNNDALSINSRVILNVAIKIN